MHKLLIEEVSLVDAPANKTQFDGAEGWVIMKSADAPQVGSREENLMTAMRCLRSQTDVLTSLEKRDATRVNIAVAALLENFAKLTPEMKRTVLDSLLPDIAKAMRDGFRRATEPAAKSRFIPARPVSRRVHAT